MDRSAGSVRLARPSRHPRGPAPTTTAIAVDLRCLQRLQHMRDHRQPADRVQHFRQAGLHPLALAGRQNHRQARAHRLAFLVIAGCRKSSPCPAPPGALAQSLASENSILESGLIHETRRARLPRRRCDRAGAAVLLDQRRDRPLRRRRRGAMDARVPALDDGASDPPARSRRPDFRRSFTPHLAGTRD